MGKSAFKIVIWGGNLSVLRSQIKIYGSADVSPWNKIFNHKTADLSPPPPHKWQFWMQLFTKQL